MDASTPWITRHEIAEADAIREFLAAAYGADMRITSNDERFFLRHRRVEAGLFALDSAYHAAELSFVVGPLPAIVAGAARLLAAATLATFPNTALLEPTIEDRHDASPRTLRRAMTYIDDHAADDLSAADIAAATRVTIRALRLAFRRHPGSTPNAYLRRARLAHAHADLVDAAPVSPAPVRRGRRVTSGRGCIRLGGPGRRSGIRGRRGSGRCRESRRRT